MQSFAETPAHDAAKSIDVARLAQRIRIFWNALRAMLVPIMIASFGFFIYVTSIAFGDTSKLALVGPFLALAPSIPLLFFVYPLATWLCWTWIGRYGRITGTFALACLTQLPFYLFLFSPYLIGFIAEVISGRLSDTDSQAKFVSLVVMVLIPEVLCVIAAVQFVSLLALSRKMKWYAHGSTPLVAFRRLVRVRRQTYRKYNFARLPFVPLALLGALVTFTVITLVFGSLLERLLPVPLQVRRDMQLFQAFFKLHPMLTLIRMVMETLIFLGTLAAMVWWARFAWRSIRRRATDVLKDPNYRPVVFLRSFRDEDARVASKNPFWSLLRAQVRLEEVIAGQLMRLGPCVAIGVPGEWVPRLGAMRAYFADADWQTAIRAWTDRAVLSVVMAGSSLSVLWELEYLIWSNRTSTLLLILPPDESQYARARRWKAVSKIFAGTRWQQGVASADVSNALCVTFDADGTVIAVTGWARHQVDYDIAVQSAAVRLLAAPRPSSR